MIVFLNLHYDQSSILNKLHFCSLNLKWPQNHAYLGCGVVEIAGRTGITELLIHSQSGHKNSIFSIS